MCHSFTDHSFIMWKIIFYSSFLLFFFTPNTSLAKVVSCEGFVKSKIPGIDLSRVQAKLFTNHGNLKYETECDAQNGHFLIPIYNKGHYLVRVSGPAGWIFSEPNSRAVEISDDGTGCADDIIIELVGFEIVGNVLNEGGAKLSLGLYTAKDGILVAKTETDGRGQYKFSAKPGVYKISTMADAGQCVALGTVSVEVVNGPVKVQPDITLAGHNVRVAVVDEWGNKMGTKTTEEGENISEDDSARTEREDKMGASSVVTTLVELHSDKQIDFRHLPVDVQRPRLVTHSAQHITTTAGEKTDDHRKDWTYALETRTGVALFACLPSAQYTLSAFALLQPHNGVNNSRIGVHFERKTVQVGANALEAILSVANFRLFGTVLDPLGRPFAVDAVSILLDGVARAATKAFDDKEEGQAVTDGPRAPIVGLFELDKIVGGKHRIGASKEHYEFDQIVADVSTKFVGLIELRTKRMAFCGTVSPMIAGKVSVEVKPMQQQDNSDKGTVIVKPDGNGHFCHMFGPAKYTAQVISPTVYTPQHQLVDLTEKPLVDVKFTQFLGTISGHIECLGACDKISVQLLSNDTSHTVVATAKLKRDDGTFEFARILPSVYIVRLVSPENVWWEATEETVTMVDKNMDGLLFKQKGFKMSIHSTHPAKMEYSPNVAKQNNMPSSAADQHLKIVHHLVSGLNTLFFPRLLPENSSAGAKTTSTSKQQPQQQKFKFTLNSCHEFGTLVNGVVGDRDGRRTTMANDAGNNEFTIPGTTRIDLIAKATLFPVRVELASNIPSGSGEQDSLMMHMVDVTLNCDGCSPAEALHSLNISDANINGSTARTFVFRLDQQRAGTQFTAMAHSARHLFTPEGITFKFDGVCQQSPIVFRAHLGKFIEGKVSPTISEVAVTATRQKNGKAMELHTKTDDEGKFRIGPVWDEREFVLTLEKEGFEFKQNNPSDDPGPLIVYSATKLSQLVVRFVDSQLKTPLADVLVSVSGSSNFRSNTVTDQMGTFSIVGLAPDTYFIRPILKEYKFAANSFSAQIAEGQTEEMVLEAKRYAYSIYGKVSTISSKALPSPIYVEALSNQCENHQEDDMVDSMTNEFRVRGLKPSCQYKVFLKDEDGERIRAFPAFFNVQTSTDDKRGVEFVVFPSEKPEAIVAGELELPDNATIAGNSFRVLLRDSATGKTVQEQSVHGTVFFFTLPAYRKHFSIELDRSEAKRMKIEHISEGFFADSPFTFIKLIPRPQQRSVDIEVHKANYVGLALILLITLAFMNQTKTKLFVAFLVERAQKFVQTKNRQSSQQIGLSFAELDRRRKAKKQ